MDSVLSEEIEVKLGIHQGSVLLPFLFALVVDVVTEVARDGVQSESLHADDFVVMSETIKGLRDKFLKWKEAIESKSLKVHLEKTKAMVSCRITQDGLSKSKVGPCSVCSSTVKANTILRGRWIHGRCAREKRVTTKLAINHTCRKCEENIGGSGAGREAM